MVDRDGRQVLMCTWGKKSMEDEMDFTVFGDIEHGDLIDINVGDLKTKSLYKYGLFSAWQVLLFLFYFLCCRKNLQFYPFSFNRKEKKKMKMNRPSLTTQSQSELLSIQTKRNWKLPK